MAAICLTGCSIPLKTASASKWKNPFVKPDPTEVARKAALDPNRGMDELDEALKLYEDEKYYEAEKKFKAIAKKHKDYFVEEDAMFYEAECQYKQKRYAYAQDSYAGLIKKYPSTRHMDVSTGRLFNIAGYWLGNNDLAKADKITQVAAEDVGKKDRPAEDNPYKFSLTPNLFDRTRPTFDTNGRALQALKSVWLNDPMGPLADDALMMTAGYHVLVGNYREADHHLKILREEYPKSEYAKQAYLLGPHVKLMTYQGALYDTKPLDEARTILQTSMNLYPDEKNQEKMIAEMENIRQMTAQEGAKMAEYWRRKGKHNAAAIYSELVLKNYPDTESANEAKQILSKIDKKHRQGILEIDEKMEEEIARVGHKRTKKESKVAPPEETAEETEETKEQTAEETPDEEKPTEEERDDVFAKQIENAPVRRKRGRVFSRSAPDPRPAKTTSEDSPATLETPNL
ncbi:MAG: outer membrane protein assembly factor BamD [Planctomycetales bacterium]